MRFYPIITLVPFVALIPLAASIAGCEPTLDVGGRGGGATASCEQQPSCPTSQECLATFSNAGKPQFGLRVAELAVTSPPTLATEGAGLFMQALFAPDLPACSQLGGGLTSWLLRFDLEHQTLTMGGAAPPADPSQPYTLVDALVQQNGASYHLAPVTFDLASNAAATFSTASRQDFYLPMYFPAATGNGAVGPDALPIHDLAASNIVISPSHDCIGRYDAAIFDPNQGCTPSMPNRPYVPGGELDGYISLEEVDGIVIAELDQTLCVFITGDATTYGDHANAVSHCVRENGVIAFKGDWCAATNAAATATCFDAVRFHAGFAASAAHIQ